MSIRLRIEGRYGNRAVTIIAPDEPPATADLALGEAVPSESIVEEPSAPSGLGRILQSIVSPAR
jgi:hypothetical protein